MWKLFSWGQSKSQCQENRTHPVPCYVFPNAFQPAAVSLDSQEDSPSVNSTIYPDTGVGVYLGEIVTIRQWGLSYPPRWVIDRLRFGDLNQVYNELYSELGYTICLLNQYHLQPALLKHYLKRINEIKTHKCPYKFAPNLPKPTLPEPHDENQQTVIPTQQERQEPQIAQRNQLCLDCPIWQLIHSEIPS